MIIIIIIIIITIIIIIIIIMIIILIKKWKNLKSGEEYTLTQYSQEINFSYT